VLAGIGFITRPGKGLMTDKIWVVYVGAILGIILLRFAANAFVRLLERFPALDNVAYLLVGWVGLKLGSHSLHKAHEEGVIGFSVPGMSQAFFWTGLILIAVLGVLYAVQHQKKDGGTEPETVLEQNDLT
jgi:predicted tellurium resistance membrane protein TerC